MRKIIALGIEGMQIEDMDDFREFLETIRSIGIMSTNRSSSRKSGTAVKVYLSDTPSGRDTLSALRAEIIAPALVPDIDLGTLDISLKTVQEGDWSTPGSSTTSPHRSAKSC